MPNCHDIEPLVTPFIDGDLPEVDRRAVADHLRVCSPCHSRIAAEREVHELIRARVPALKKTEAPDSLHARCWELARLEPHADAAAPPATMLATALPPRRLVPYALAASLVLMVGGAFVYQATDKSARVLAAELTADHMKCFALNRALGTAEGAEAVESSMSSGFNWHVHLPDDPSRMGMELVGSRPCLYGEGRIAHIMYRHEGHPVSLFMLPKTARTEQLVEVLGHEAKIWCVGNRTFVLLAREPRANVERMASFVQASLH
ncbi:MAG: anti-sigma factor family protein [Vicinamibacterales bacterium]